MRSLLLVGCFICGCSHSNEVDRSKCTELRDHVVELRLAGEEKTEGVDVAQHRAAMKQALGEQYISNCVRSITIEQLRCELKATDLSATKDCAGSSPSH